MKYIALHNSYGWLQRHWKEGEITPDTAETPPESKVLGPLFESLYPAPVAEKVPALKQEQETADVEPVTESDSQGIGKLFPKASGKLKPKRK